jgi:hypothetical protein
MEDIKRSKEISLKEITHPRVEEFEGHPLEPYGLSIKTEYLSVMNLKSFAINLGKM